MVKKYSINRNSNSKKGLSKKRLSKKRQSKKRLSKKRQNSKKYKGGGNRKGPLLRSLSIKKPKLKNNNNKPDITEEIEKFNMSLSGLPPQEMLEKIKTKSSEIYGLEPLSEFNDEINSMNNSTCGIVKEKCFYKGEYPIGLTFNYVENDPYKESVSYSIIDYNPNKGTYLMTPLYGSHKNVGRWVQTTLYPRHKINEMVQEFLKKEKSTFPPTFTNLPRTSANLTKEQRIFYRDRFRTEEVGDISVYSDPSGVVPRFPVYGTIEIKK
jgi:hypothetical protein